ncbi:YpoC family protein [Sporolactobacillus kofuensis]|uniref:YpoC family protein n=1 Tax=Sporolactobacillus kofuensis TaxID=269672 RepID=A0ABW1WEB0_9BACL|nr:hypothetical protein [Sporolactobacillus kofuensis]MCO7176176.1 hypothetical protein [Sporolactobacillus kofuensis]
MEQPCISIELTDSFHVKPFYQNCRLLDVKAMPSHFSFEYPFFYDMLYCQQKDAYSLWPWQTRENYFHIFWEQKKEELRTSFHDRNLKAVRQPMLQSIAAFIDQMYWSAGKPVRSLVHDVILTDLSTLPFAPLNSKERVNYLLKQPDRYLSFIQLDELEQELVKKLAIYRRKQKIENESGR